MNKYEEALHYFEKYIGVTDNTVTNQLVEEYTNILNELINKETPMKPIKNDRYCGNCDKIRLLPQDNYCKNCGQKIDWSKNED